MEIFSACLKPNKAGAILVEVASCFEFTALLILHITQRVTFDNNYDMWQLAMTRDDINDT